MGGSSWHCTGGSDQDHPQGKETQKGKWLSEEALQISETREVKGEGEKERYTHLNAELQRIPRRDTKGFLNDQRNRENSRMWKTSDLFEKIGDAKEIFHAKIGTIKYRNGMNLIEPQFSSVTQLCPTLCDPMNCGRPGLPVHHQLPEFTQIHVHQVGDAIQPSHPLSSLLLLPSPLVSQHQGLFHWVSSSHQVAKVLEVQLQHQSFQWIPRTDLL